MTPLDFANVDLGDPVFVIMLGCMIVIGLAALIGLWLGPEDR